MQAMPRNRTQHKETQKAQKHASPIKEHDETSQPTVTRKLSQTARVEGLSTKSKLSGRRLGSAC